MNSVVQLRHWIASQLEQFHDNDDVTQVLRYIRRKTDHPCFSSDGSEGWDKFLKTIDCRKILTQV
jgi:hypothetical protein